MILKGCFYWTLAVLVMSVAILLAWNQAVIYLPIEGIVFKKMSFQTAANLSFWILLAQLIGVGVSRLIIRSLFMSK